MTETENLSFGPKIVLWTLETYTILPIYVPRVREEKKLHGRATKVHIVWYIILGLSAKEAQNLPSVLRFFVRGHIFVMPKMK